jgi:hypothetical protein
MMPGLAALNGVTNASPAGAAQLPFGVHWPPADPASLASPATTPLLLGLLSVKPEQSDDLGWQLRMRITLRRATDEAAREYWNSRLAFAEIDWM